MFLLFDITKQVLHIFSYLFYLSILSGDIEVNPGPNSSHELSVCHWNLDSIGSHNFAKLSLLEAYNAIHNFDIICLSETYLDSSVLSENPSLSLDGYTLVRADDPGNVKRGGVCVYHKNILPICFLNISLLQECLVFEFTLEKQKCILMTLYRSPSQSNDEFDNFMTNFELTLDVINNMDPFLFIVLGDFNAKSCNWKKTDKSTSEGKKVEDITLMQLITCPTHIMPNSSSCIDLIFTNQTNLVVDSGVHSSLHPNCHHQIIFAKFNLNVFYPPPYERLVWRYHEAKKEQIFHAVNNFDWNRAFENLDIDAQIKLFNETVINIFTNYVPHKTIVCNDRDPPWIDDSIKDLIFQKERAYEMYLLNQSDQYYYQNFQQAKENLCNLLQSKKNDYYKGISYKLSDARSSPKCYWSLLKTVSNGRKVPCIPPIFNEYNEFVIDFIEKSKIFNNFFSKQCSVIENNSELPINFSKLTNNTISSVNFETSDLLQIIRNLDVNKAHGHDNISVRMLKICDTSICKPLELIFRNCLNQGLFPSEWKKAHVVPIHKKGSKHIISNYRPISLLSVCGKVFEKNLYKSIFDYLTENNLLSSNQSGFKPGDSCTNQLLSISHEIYSSLDKNLETRAVFLDISKAFDRVWHEGLIHKLKLNGIQGNLLNVLTSFLNSRKQRVVLNGQCSDWKNVSAGVPQGSILGPLFFLIYINDLPDGLITNAKLFADDTSLFSTVFNSNNSASDLNHDLEKISSWAFQWKMSFNPDPSKQAQEVIFSRKLIKPIHSPLFFNNEEVIKSTHQKHLGIILDEKLNLFDHVSSMISKANKGIGIIRKLHSFLPRSALITIYKSFVRSHLDYGDILYDQPTNESFTRKIESVQYNAALAITGAIRGTSRDKLYKELGLESLQSRRWMRRLCLFFKVLKNEQPNYLFDIIPKNESTHNTRFHHNIPSLRVNRDFFKNSFFPSTIGEWNGLDMAVRSSASVSAFKSSLLKVIRPLPNRLIYVNNPIGLKLLTRLRLGLSHLREHKFKHNFLDSLNPLCTCGLEAETTTHFFLRCHHFSVLRLTLLDKIRHIDNQILNQTNDFITRVLLFGDNKYNSITNSDIIKISIEYIIDSKRFDCPFM